jgi:ABC-type spermidine/putrescine transport system permease subunit II
MLAGRQHARGYRFAARLSELFSAVISLSLVVALFVLVISGDAHSALLGDLVQTALGTTVFVAVPAAACVILGYTFAFSVFVRRRYFLLLVGLSPLFVPYIGLALGLRDLLGEGRVVLTLLLVLRYTPVSLLFCFLKFKQVGSDQIKALTNLGVGKLRMHLYLTRFCFPVLLVSFALTVLLTGFDSTAPSLVGGPRQYMAQFLLEWLRTAESRSSAGMVSGAAFIVAIALVATAIWYAGPQTSVATVRSGRPYPHRLGIGYLFVASLFFAYFLLVAASLAQVLAQAFLGFDVWLDEGRFALVLVTVLVCFVAALAAVSAGIFSSFSSHVNGRQHERRGRLKEFLLVTALVAPLLIPPLVGATAANLAQSELGLRGNMLSVMFWFLYFFGPMAGLILIFDPFVPQTKMAVAAYNHAIPVERYFLRVFVPRILRSAVVACLLVVVLAMNDMIIASYTGGFFKTVGQVLMERHATAFFRSDYTTIILVSLLSVGMFGVAASLESAGQRWRNRT